MQSGSVLKTSLIFVLIITCVLSSGCTTEPEEKVYTIGVLSGHAFFEPTLDGLKSGLAELGYVEGENIVYDVVKTELPVGNEDVVQNFVDDGVDLIFSYPTEASIEAKKVAQGTGIPVVFTNANIEDTGLVDSITNPGVDITGVRYPGPDLALISLDIMKEILPDAKTFWIPYQKDYPIVASQVAAIKSVAESDGISIIEYPSVNITDLQEEIDRLSELDDPGFDAILFIAEPLVVTPSTFTVVAKFAYENNIPLGGAHSASVDDYGEMFGISVDAYKVGEQAAPLVDKVLKGTPAGTIPVVSAESHLEVNYDVAQYFGVEMNEGLLSRADKVNK